MTAAEPTLAHPTERILRPSVQELLQAWREVVEAHEEQAARLREDAPDPDSLAPAPAVVEAWLRDIEDPPSDIAAVGAMAQPDDTWLDIGAGGGRSAVYLAHHVQRVVTLDVSPAMTELIETNVTNLEIDNIDVLPPLSWPPQQPLEQVDVCLAVHVNNFNADLGGFLDAMEAYARRLCVLGAAELGTAWQPDHGVFEALHGEKFVRLPGVRELLAVLGARRTRFEVQTFDFPQNRPEGLDRAHQRVRSRYYVGEGTEKDKQLRELLDEHFSVGDGQVHLPQMAGTYEILASWQPPQATA